MMCPPVLKAQGLRKTFYAPTPLAVLKGVDLEVHAKEAVAIVGKSGEGKSTLLQILGALELPLSGSVEICGIPVGVDTAAALRKHHIGFIFQHCHLLEHESVLSNTLMPARIARKDVREGSEAHARALHLIDLVGLKERASFSARLLSGGERQRAAIARALCNDPLLILADEPSGNLDSALSQEIHALLIELVKTFDKSLVVVTHDTSLSSLCHRTLLLKEGLLCIS